MRPHEWPRRATASLGRVRALGGVGGHVGAPHVMIQKFVLRDREWAGKAKRIN